MIERSYIACRKYNHSVQVQKQKKTSNSQTYFGLFYTLSFIVGTTSRSIHLGESNLCHIMTVSFSIASVARSIP